MHPQRVGRVQLRSRVRGNLRVRPTNERLVDNLTHWTPSIAFPRVLNALSLLNGVPRETADGHRGDALIRPRFAEGTAGTVLGCIPNP